MRNRVSAIKDFAGHFVRYLMFVREVLVGLLLLLLLGGFLVSHFEGIPLAQAIYFAFITGLSIGYGDITPKTGLGCAVSVAIGAIGMVLTGMTVAVATRALADATSERIHHKS